MLPTDILNTARTLVNQDKGRPRQVNLKKAISATYYAMFHTLCQNCANSFIGTSKRSNRAWNQAYRSLEHGFVRNQVRNQQVMASFPEAITKFAEIYVILQQFRHEADYDPAIRFKRHEVLNAIDFAERAINNFNRVRNKHKKAFAVWTVTKLRPKGEENRPSWLG